MNVIEGRGPSPLVVLTYVQRLPDTSLTVALASGGREFFGWGRDRAMVADLIDALNQNTRATGNWGKGKAPKIPEYERPKAKKKKRKVAAPAEPGKPVTVADLYQHFQRR
ncbi:hypothetical protein [Micromonospora sp. NPDC049240]|uniref:hypothetical protein n=1 Tax=Micromonospora sp. NPDC049240 TaxID=3155151 RepID=UPI0033CC73C7